MGLEGEGEEGGLSKGEDRDREKRNKRGTELTILKRRISNIYFCLCLLFSFLKALHLSEFPTRFCSKALQW